MQKAGKGSIIDTASFVATMGAATSQIAYTASNFLVDGGISGAYVTPLDM